MIKKIAVGLALTGASFGVAAIGTSQQHECFDEVKNEYHVTSLADLPEQVVDDSGCLSWANTLGSLGVVGCLGLTGYSVYRESKQPQAEEDQPQEA